MSSCTRQRFLLPGPMSRPNQPCILQRFRLVFVSSCHLIADFEIRRPKIFWKIICARLLEFTTISWAAKGSSCPVHVMKAHRGSRLFYSFLFSTINGGLCLTSRSDCFTPGKNTGTHFIGNLVGLRDGINL